MRPADLLAIAVPTAPNAATTAASSAEDADAFARALASEQQSEQRAEQTGDGHCGVGSSAAEPGRGGREPVRPDGVRDWERPEAGERPDRGAFSEWRGFLQNLRELGLLAGGLRSQGAPTAEGATAKPAGLTALTAGSDTSAPKPSPIGQAFHTALEALGSAIDAAIQNPGANPAQPGQLPAAVQTALDAAIAAAPAALQPRIQAFAARLTERLATAMAAGSADGEGEEAATVASADGAGRSSRSVAQAVLDALGQTGQTPTPVMPELERREARATAAPPAEAKAAPETPAPAQTTTASAPSADARAAPAEPAAAAPVALAANEPAAPAEPAPLAAAPVTAAEAHAATLTAVRGSPELVAQMAATLVRKLDGRVTRFNMELNPAELGRVDVKLSIDKDGRVAAQMAFDNPVAAADMRGRADELRRQLEQAGFQVAGEDLTFTDRETSQGFDRSGRSPLNDPDVARDRAIRDAERTARLAEDAGRLQNRAVIGLDMRV